MLNLTENALAVLEKRYLAKDEGGRVIETPEQMFRRVAHAIASADLSFGETESEVEKLESDFYEMMTETLFIPNSPTLMNAGKPLGQLSACFVLPVEDSMEGIFNSLKHTALIHKSGGGTGFSFSRLRPMNDVVSSTGGIASGPVSFMKVFDAATEAIKQGGTRRGANMGILRVDHPDILEFITCKADGESVTNFNISVGLTEEFMKAVEQDQEYDLVNPHTKTIAKRLKAKRVFELIVNLAWKNGDPGIIFLDRINKDNPTPKTGEIEATNPCGEQPLLPYESCNLGSINLGKILKNKTIDYSLLRSLVWKSVHFLDNVIEKNNYPIREISEMTKSNRKIGLGVMGFADMLIQLQIPYNSEPAIEKAEEIMSFIQNEAVKASEDLAVRRGPFPAFKESIFKTPRRNSTVTTIAPTGTISIIANASSGIEPLFAISYTRQTPTFNLVETNPLFEKIAKERGFYSEGLMERISKENSIQGFHEIPEDVRGLFVTAHDIAPEWHIRIQAAFQKYTENAVSKTVNFRNDATTEDVKKVYLLAYKLGCKGVTIYRDGSRDIQVLSVKKENKEKKEESGEKSVESKIVPRTRPSITFGTTEKINTGCGNLYVTVNRDEHGMCELFSQIGKAGGCASAQSEAISRLISLALRSGVEVGAVVKQLKGIRCSLPVWDDGELILSCPDAIAKIIEHRLQNGFPGEFPAGEAKQLVYKTLPSLEGETPDTPLALVTAKSQERRGACPDCGGSLEYKEGCDICHSCGYSRCG